MTHYGKNTHLIDSDINVLFEELLEMNPDQFEQWVIDLRKSVVDIWDNKNVPPRRGKEDRDIIDQWNKMCSYPIHKFTFTDELSDIEDDVIVNTSKLGVEADQWFPNMYKVRINYTEKDTGYSIYDLFADDKFKERMVKGCNRHFKRDSMYLHAPSCVKNNKKTSLIDCEDAAEYVRTVKSNREIFGNHDFMLEQVKIKEGMNSGYNQVDHSNILQLTKEQVMSLKHDGILEYRHHSTFDINDMPDDRVYSVRLYKRGNRIFPKGFAAFRIGYIQPAVNFPPMTAKYIWDRYTEEFKDDEVIKIYDPSAGWGGRILGAMSAKDDRKIHYIGTDPNPDNFYEDRSKYADIADFYNTKTYRGCGLFPDTNTYEIHQLGSEVIQHDPEFQKHKGEISVAFTSPPYFNREAYSEDENQSYKKHGSSYESWRDGFLQPTIETIAEWLRPNGYMIWNIADILNRGNYLPLEQDSINIAEQNGLKYLYTLKMRMEGMPGQNRVGEDGKPLCKNYCQVNGEYQKHEPIFVFKKVR